MGDVGKEGKPDAAAAPPARHSAESRSEQVESRETRLEQARRFLQDAQVQSATRERKAEFLKSKGLSEGDIEELLKEVASDVRTSPRDSTREETIEPPIATKKEDRPPIVTYPEFLTKPQRPPPLVTVNGFLNTLYAFGALSTVVYGASKYVVEPMVNTLTEARISLHDRANQDLAKLVSKLEQTVSEIPPMRPKAAKKAATADSIAGDDAVSDYDDPTELFHRDVGVQTSLPPTPFGDRAGSFSSSYSKPQAETATAEQAERLSSLLSSLREVRDGLAAQGESYDDVKTVLEALQDDLDRLSGAAAAATDFVGGFSLYGMGGGRPNEPDDEIRRAKENIRRVKGVLLSTRSFPTSAR